MARPGHLSAMAYGSFVWLAPDVLLVRPRSTMLGVGARSPRGLGSEGVGHGLSAHGFSTVLTSRRLRGRSARVMPGPLHQLA